MRHALNPRSWWMLTLIGVALMSSAVCADPRPAKPEDLTLTLDLLTFTEQPEVRTPLLAVARLTNRSREQISVCTGTMGSPALLFLIAEPGEAPTGPSADVLSEMGNYPTGAKLLAPGETYSRVVFLNDSVRLRRVGTYRVEAVMSDWRAWRASDSGSPDKWPTLARAQAEITLGPGSPESRRQLCERLALEFGGAAYPAPGTQSVFPAVRALKPDELLGGSITEALFYLDDEVPLPYLADMAETGWRQAFERMAKIGTPAAILLLRDLAGSPRARTASYAERQLELLGLPASEKAAAPAPPVGATPSSAMDLVKQLAAETGATVICAGSPEELTQPVPPAAGSTAERLQAAGFSVHTSGDGKLTVLLRHSPEQDRRPAETLTVALSRLIAAMSPEDPKLADAWWDLRCADLSARTRPALAEAVSLLQDYYGFRGMKVTDAEVPGELYVQVFPIYMVAERWRGPHGAVHLSLDDNRSFHFCDPPLGMPADAKPPTGSVLWGLWPYAASGWAKRPVTLPAGPGTLSQLVQATTGTGKAKIQLGPESETLPVYVAGGSADLGHLLWALELLTGNVFQPRTTDPLVITALPPVAPALPGFAGDPNSPVAGLLETLDPRCISPLRTEAGPAWVRRGNFGDTLRPLAVAWRTADLPNAFRFAHTPRTGAESWSPQADRTLFWLAGLRVSLVKRQGTQGYPSPPVFLPFF